MSYRVYERPANGSAGQDVGTFDLAALPERLQAAIAADPNAGTWALPSLSEGDSGDELADLDTVVEAR